MADFKGNERSGSSSRSLSVRYIGLMLSAVLLVLVVVGLFAKAQARTIEVTVLMFSGRPNPTFVLDETESEEFLRLMAGYGGPSQAVTSEVFPFWPKPGLGGFSVALAGVDGLPDRIEVYNDVVSHRNDVQSILWADTSGIDAWLTNIAEDKLAVDFGTDVFSNYRNRIGLSDQVMHQAAATLADGIIHPEAMLAVVRIGDRSLIGSVEGNAPWHLVDAVVEEVIRGDLPNEITILHTSRIIENMRARPFADHTSGSRWLLVLRRPQEAFPSLTAEFESLSKEGDVGNGYDPAVTYGVDYYGYGAVCLEWVSETVAEPTQVMATDQEVADIRHLVGGLKSLPDTLPGKESLGQLEASLETDFGRSAMRKIADKNRKQ